MKHSVFSENKNNRKAVGEEWHLVYKRGMLSAVTDIFAIIQSAFIALISVGSLLFSAAFSFGFLGDLSAAKYVNSNQQTFWGPVSVYLLPIVTGLLAYWSVSELVKALLDGVLSSRVYEGVLDSVNKRSVAGLHMSYPMLSLVCQDETWEVYPRGLEYAYMFQPGGKIRVLYTAGSRTIKRLWVGRS